MTKIEARFIIEITGKPKESVDEALKKLIEKLKEERDLLEVVESSIEEAVEDEKGELFSGFVEIDAKFRDIEKLMGFIAHYTPTSIEISEPEYFKFDSAELSSLLNDISNIVLSSMAEKHALRMHVRHLMKKVEKLEKEKKN